MKLSLLAWLPFALAAQYPLLYDASTTDLLQALEVMQSQFFEVWQGTWPDAIDWTRAVMGTHIAAGLHTFSKSQSQLSLEHENLINSYFSHLTVYYFGQDAFSLRLQAYDDMLWVVLGWLDSLQFLNHHSDTHFLDGDNSTWYGKSFTPAFAHRARVFWELAANGWDDTLCGGGMTWNPRLTPYKNAITNELFIAASINMHLYYPGDDIDFPILGMDDDKKYLHAAVKGYDWLRGSNMTNIQGLYFDGFHIEGWRKGDNGTGKCDIPDFMVYTYNQGVVLSASRGLWQATGETSYLTSAHELIRNVIAATGWSLKSNVPDSSKWAGLGRSGVLEDACDAGGYCSQDAQTFKGIFFHHLTVFCQPLSNTYSVPGHRDETLHLQSCREYAPWVQRNAKAAVGTRDDKGIFGMWWTIGLEDYQDQVSEIESVSVEGVDYRNRGIPSNDIWGNGARSMANRFVSGRTDVATDDPNERGRGRTVESHSGGVAVLRAHYEFSKL